MMDARPSCRPSCQLGIKPTLHFSCPRHPPCCWNWTQMQWILGYGSLGGALWFLLSAVAALLEQANPHHP